MAATLSDNAIANISHKSIPYACLANLNATIGDFESLASQISRLKKEILEKEAAILKEILDRVTPLVHFLSKDYEAYYRRELVILTTREEVQLEETSGFYSEYRLILYENGLLVKAHRYGEWSRGPRPGWELTDEEELIPQSAIKKFGLPTIAECLIKAFEEADSTIILREELKKRLGELTKVLEALE